jgi:thiamine kinase-like enzyme
MTEFLPAILNRVPIFTGKTDLVITDLSGGLTNRNYKIDTSDGNSYVLRVGGNDTRLLGIDRLTEYGCTQAASSVGVAPEPIAFLEPEGYLVTRFVAGAGIPMEVLAAPDNLRRVVASLKAYHALPHFPGYFSPFRIYDSYLPIARQYNAPLPANIDWYGERAAEIERAFLRQPFTSTPCHNDLLNGNFIDDGNLIRILDWEYAGMGDPFFDLANLSAQNEFTQANDETLLTEYFSVYTPAQFARHQLMKIMSDLREAMWAMVQCNVSQIEFDYVGYGMKYFDRIERTVKGESYQKFLGVLNESKDL